MIYTVSLYFVNYKININYSKKINNNITDIGWKVINQNRLSAIVSNKRQEETETGAFSGNAGVVGCTDGVGAMAQQLKALATQS